jgi:glycosyltransferase involved in cell wall biosynthesis
MTVSVIIPTYNRAALIGATLESAFSQSFRDFEIIVVDDGSTDNTGERLKSLTASGRIRYFQQQNRGPSAARNRAAMLATGDILSFLDSDDLWQPGKLECEVEFLLHHPEVQGVFTDIEYRDGPRSAHSFMRSHTLFPRLLNLAESAYPDGIALPQRDLYLCLLEESPIRPSALSVRTEAFAKVGGFDESITSAEDREFLIRFARDRSLGYIDRRLVTRRILSDSLQRTETQSGGWAQLRYLSKERKRLAPDAEGRRAAERGIKEASKGLGWHYLARKQRARAFKVYLWGFRETGAPELLLRALRLCIPRYAGNRSRRSLTAGMQFAGPPSAHELATEIRPRRNFRAPPV